MKYFNKMFQMIHSEISTENFADIVCFFKNSL